MFVSEEGYTQPGIYSHPLVSTLADTVAVWVGAGIDAGFFAFPVRIATSFIFLRSIELKSEWAQPTGRPDIRRTCANTARADEYRLQDRKHLEPTESAVKSPL